MRFLSRSPHSLKTVSGSASYASLSASSSPPGSPTASSRRWDRQNNNNNNNGEDTSNNNPSSQSGFMRPLVALALPGMYLIYKYNQYRKQRQEISKRKAAEREIVQLNNKIDKLLVKLDEQEPEMALTPEEECVICVNAKATMQTFPCGHQVVCRKCFVKTIQVAVSQRLLPLRCVVCRAKVLRLRQSREGFFPTSVSQYSMTSCSPDAPGGIHQQMHPSGRMMPTSHSLYSFASDSSWLSGVSNVSSASSESGDSFVRIYRQGSHSTVIKKVKVSSKSGARNKEPSKSDLPEIQIENYDFVPVVMPAASRSPRALLKENKVAPQEVSLRLPTIKEYSEYISEKEGEKPLKPSSTRIRCARKLVNQVESGNSSHDTIIVPPSHIYCNPSPVSGKPPPSSPSSMLPKANHAVYSTGNVKGASGPPAHCRNSSGTVQERMWAVSYKEVKIAGSFQSSGRPPPSRELWGPRRDGRSTPSISTRSTSYPPKTNSIRVGGRIPMAKNPSPRKQGAPTSTKTNQSSKNEASKGALTSKGGGSASGRASNAKMATSASTMTMKPSSSVMSSLSDTQAFRIKRKEAEKKDQVREQPSKKDKNHNQTDICLKMTQKRKFNGKEYQRLQ